MVTSENGAKGFPIIYLAAAWVTNATVDRTVFAGIFKCASWYTVRQPIGRLLTAISPENDSDAEIISTNHLPNKLSSCIMNTKYIDRMKPPSVASMANCFQFFTQASFLLARWDVKVDFLHTGNANI